MAKIDPNKLRRKPKGTFTATLADSLSEVSQVVTFRYLSTAELLAAQDDADALRVQYIVNAEPIGSVDGQPVYVSTQAIQLASIMSFAQEAGGADRYSAVELLMLMVSDEITDSLTEAFHKIMKGAPKEEETVMGNSSETTEAPSLVVVSS